MMLLAYFLNICLYEVTLMIELVRNLLEVITRLLTRSFEPDHKDGQYRYMDS